MSKQIDNPSYYDLEEATALMRDFIPFLFGSNKVSSKNQEILMELSSTKLSPEVREDVKKKQAHKMECLTKPFTEQSDTTARSEQL